MSLYGALYTGVTGLDTQGQKIGIISDNIANVNTVGYKESEAQFETLVINSNTRATYSPGGVRNETRTNVDKQGIISSTAASTDIAVSGNGFFVVNASADSSSQSLYTRAGSFRQDALGNFRNSQGFFLQGWPLDRDGRLPGEPGNVNIVSSANTESLQTVNVETASGVAQATTELELGINLDAGQDVFPGAAGNITMDIQSSANYKIASGDIIVPDELSGTAPSFGLATTNNIARGDKFTVSTGEGLSYDYQYGGFSIGRNITSSNLATNTGDGNTNLAPTDIHAAGGDITTIANTAAYEIDFGAPHGLTTGDRVRLSGVVMGGATSIPASAFTGIQTVTVTGPNTVTVATSVAEGAVAFNSTAALVNQRVFAGNIFDSISETQAFFGSGTDLNDYTDGALQFTITSPSVAEGTVTFTYVPSSPDVSTNQFNSLRSLAEAINGNAGLTARVVGGRLVVGASDANQSISFANVDSNGSGALFGLDWVSELDLQNVSAGTRRFSTQAGLAALVNADEGISATITNPLSESTLDIFVDDPLDTIRFQDFVDTQVALGNNPVGAIAGPVGGAYTLTITQNAHGFSNGDNILLSGLTDIGVPPNQITAAELNRTFSVSNVTATTYDIVVTSAAVAAPAAPGGGAAGMVQATNAGSLLAEFGLVSSLAGGAYVRGDTGNLGPVYDASGSNGDSMASGKIQAHFSRTVRVYDSLGAGHDLRVAFLKTGQNEWAAEVYSVDPKQVNTVGNDGLIASGTINFNGDASLKSVIGTIGKDITVKWTNGAAASTISLGLGDAGLPFGTEGALTIGDTNGLSQFDSNFNVAFLNQNGAPVGELISVAIDEDGFVIASFSNGESQKLYKIPLADFSNPNGLKSISGNVYAQTVESGELNLRNAGSNGVGDIVSNALEASNVDLAEQLTDMIIAQRAYQANTRVISTSDQLLEQLTQL